LQGHEQRAACVQHRHPGERCADEHAVGQGDAQAGATGHPPTCAGRGAGHQEKVRARREQGKKVGGGDEQELFHQAGFRVGKPQSAQVQAGCIEDYCNPPR
jgi:hypothetical protein